MIQAGDSDAGREFAAAHADGIFSRHGKLEEGQRFYADVKGRLARYGRAPHELLILPGTTFILGDTDAEAQEIADEVRHAQVSGPHAIMFLEQLWNRDLSAYDPDGPLPEVDPDLDAQGARRGLGPGTDAAARGDRDRGSLARSGARPTTCRSASW